MTTLLLKGIRSLVTMDEALGEMEGASILIDGPAIARVVPKGEPLPAADETIDLSRHLVTPGLVNCHHHFYQTLTRNVPAVANAGLFDWLVGLYDIWARMTPEDIRDAAAVAAAELLLSGCTTALDHFYVFPNGRNECFDAEVEGVAPTGLRLHLTRGSMSLSRKDGGLPPDSVVQRDDEILAHSEEVIGRYHDPARFSMLRVVLAPCSPFSVTPGIMKETAEMARAKDVHLHTHLCETADEEAFCLRTYGKRPVDYVESVGWMDERSIFAHCVHLDDGEIGRFARRRVGVAYCATSNMRLASGIAPVVPMLRAGVKVGLGVDGSASNDSSHMAAEVRQAMLLQRVRYGADSITTRDALRLATVGGANVLGRDEIGRIAPGMAADLAAWDLGRVFYAGALHDPPGILALCHSNRAAYVIVNGRVVVEKGELRTIDLGALVRRHNANSRRLAAGAR
jgi:cytosine/adenosine deaminase-related metal-dependent hydrolase